MSSTSKLAPAQRYKGVDKNVWVEFSALAAEHKAVNVGQGFPDFNPPDHVKQALQDTLSEHHMIHQYTRGFGHPKLVNTLAKMFSPLIGHAIDPYKGILVTIGAYGSLFASIEAFVEPGDEVIIIEPYFDCYKPMVKVAGGIPKFTPLRPKKQSGSSVLSSSDWILDMDEIKSLFNSKTKAIILNTPNNPLGKVFTKEELQAVADLCIEHDCLCISDEVYEWVTYDDHKHFRIASLPGMWGRTITIGSAGKTFSVTGWKVGWSLGPPHLIKHLQTVWQNSVYVCPTAVQEASWIKKPSGSSMLPGLNKCTEAVARGLETEMRRLDQDDSYFKTLSRELKVKRDRMAKVLVEAGLKPIIPDGGYFMVADASNLNVDLGDSADSGESWDYRLVKWLTANKKVATIPNSAFYCEEHKPMAEKYIRFCFCKEDETLDKMERIFREWLTAS